MKKILLCLVIAAFSIGVAISASSISAFADDEKPAKEGKHKMYGDKPKSATGKIKAIDAKAKTVTLTKKDRKEKKEIEITVTVTDKTKFKEIDSLDDLKVGDKIGAKYVEKDGKMIAKSIEKKVQGERKGHKKKGHKEEKEDGE